MNLNEYKSIKARKLGVAILKNEFSTYDGMAVTPANSTPNWLT